MTSLVVSGGHSLKGDLRIQGSKNAALPMLAAAVLNRGTTMLYHCPKITDVDCMLEILESLGCFIRWEGGGVVLMHHRWTAETFQSASVSECARPFF